MASKKSLSEKHRPTLADYAVTAISPALIVGLVGSLVFFLVEIFYAGRYEGRLLWTLFFFVVGIVLVERIAIQIDAARAAGYGLVLAGVSWVALLAFVDYPKGSRASDFAGLINLVLMLVVWWCAHKLTWDCTHIDEKRQASGRGLLAAAGLEQRPETAGQVRDEDLREEEQAAKDDSLSLMKRWRRFRERRKKRPHTPGITVVWFSLAALPIFGLGQSLIPASESGRRSFTFWLAVGYVGSALGLLLTTSFLGLRRYLRQRKLQMPKAMAGAWLGLGAALVLGFLVVAALLPRPYSETPIWGLSRLGSKDRHASKNAVLSDSAAKGEGRGGNQTQAGKGDAVGKKGDPGGDGKDDEGKEGSGDKKDGSGGNGKEKSGEGKDGKEKGREGEHSGDRQQQSQGKPTDEKGEDANSSGDPDRRFPDTKLGNALEKLVGFLKWVIFILIALIVLAFLFRGALKYLANFMPWARDWLSALQAWWARLWGRKDGNVVEDLVVVETPKRRPFSSFSDPFADGTAEGRSVEELVAYSFAALEAWAADRNHPRRPDETALEFASRLSNTFPSLAGEPHALALLVVRLAYAIGTLPLDARDVMERVWDRLTAAMTAAAAAG
jgi:hypothetical protein